MKYLFSKSNIISLNNLLLEKTLFAFDFDGTLVNIKKHPDLIKLSSKTSKLLNFLSTKTSVAIISGRSVDNLRKYITNTNIPIIGNHGIENSFFDKDSVELMTKSKEITSSWVSQIESDIGFIKNNRELYIENKTNSLSIHYRNTKEKNNAIKNIEKLIKNIIPTPKIISGKDVINLLPTLEHNKGTALLKIMSYLRKTHAFYIGDDDTDEDIFCLENENIFSCRVGYKKNSKAMFYLKKQSEINKLLKLLLNMHV